MAEYDYDLFVIGAGSGGVRAARLASQYGAKVAIAEEYRVGGTCVIRGCVPKKLMVYASNFSDSFKDARGYGWSFKGEEFNWQEFIKTKDDEITRLNKIYIKNLKAAGVEIIQSHASLIDKNTIYLKEIDKKIKAKRILIATGSKPFIPQIKGCEHAISSNELFHLRDLPESLVIYGGGYIAVEFASIFHKLGVKVSLIYRGGPILRGFDMDLRNFLQDTLKNDGLEIITNTKVKLVSLIDEGTIIDKSNKLYEVELDNGKKIICDYYVCATGRKPNIDGLNLEDVGLKLADGGRIITDEQSKTNIDNIYAVGDVTNFYNLTPVAIREGAAFAESNYNNNKIVVNYDFIPTAVFSQPEIGTVGYSEEVARDKFSKIDIYMTKFNPMKYAFAKRENKMLMKLIVDGASNRVVGCHIIGDGAAEMIQCLAIAIKIGATKAQFDETIALHPSSAEELVLLREKQS